MRIVATGGRFWVCRQLAETVLRRLLARYGPDVVIVHGADPGVDRAFVRAQKAA
jgi:acetylglutamate kinase